MSAPVIREVIPNYTIKCMVCGQTPTVDSKHDGVIEHHKLCGVCMWGETACADPEAW